MEIKIDRKIHEDVRRDIFVSTPGNGRHRCLMGIYQIGKTELVKDWINDWTSKRKEIVSKTKLEMVDISLDALPEELKVFCVPTTFKELKLNRLSEIFKEIQKKVFKPLDVKTKTYVAIDENNNYQIKTVDNFILTVEDEEKKQAVDSIVEIMAEKNGDIIENIKKFMAAITKLGFHIILVFDEFNNGATSFEANRDSMGSNGNEREVIFELFRTLDPYHYDVEGKVNGRKYHLSILIVSRQEFGMITGKTDKNSKDNEIYRYARMSGFTKSQIKEYISGLKKIQGYDELTRVYRGTEKLEKLMLNKCGKHPGLWGNMPRVLRYMYDEKLNGNSVNLAFKEYFEQSNIKFFENVVFLLKETKEKVGENIVVSAYKVYVNKFIDSTYYNIKQEIMENCLELMARQGLIICCAKEDSLCEMEKRWTKKERTNLFSFIKPNMQDDVYEMHTPYFEEHLKGILYSPDVEDVVKSSEIAEKTMRELIIEVYKIKYGTQEKYQMKMLNRTGKKEFWIQSVQRNSAYQLEQENELQYVNPKKIKASADEQAKKWEKNQTPLNVLAFGEYAWFVKQYPNVFGPAFKKYVSVNGEGYQFEASFNTMIKKLAELRNARAHLDGLEVLTPKDWKKQSDLCREFTAQMENGWKEVQKKAEATKENRVNWVPKELNKQGCAIKLPQTVVEKLLDLYDVPFMCLSKEEDKAEGYITYEGNNYAAQIIQRDLCRKGKSESEYYNQIIQEGQSVQVDVVWYNDQVKYGKHFVVCPIERSGVEHQWKKVEELVGDGEN